MGADNYIGDRCGGSIRGGLVLPAMWITNFDKCSSDGTNDFD